MAAANFFLGGFSMNTQWNAEVVTPVEEGAGTKVLDNQSNVQPTLEAGSNITIANGEISATGGGAEYTAGSGISINNNTISVDSDIRSGAAAGATAVQAADLATVATSGSYNDLSNTPTIPTVDQSYSASSANAQSGVAVAGAISGKQDTISDLDTIRSGAALGATAVQASQLATVATSGSYNDLSNTPTIPAAQVNSDWDAVSGVSQILNKPTLATVATSGSYNDLSNTPTIPTVSQSYNALSTDAMSGTAVAEAISGTGQVPSVTSGDNGKVLKATYEGGVGSFGWDAAPSGVPSTTSSDEGKVLGVTDNQGSLGWVSQTPAQVNSDWNAVSGAAQILNKPTLATVATSGSYADLSNKPTIPTVDQVYDSASANAQSGVAVASAVSGKQDTISDLSTIRSGAEAGATAVQPSQLATVATSGSYADLSNTPTIPTVDQTYSAVSTNAQSGVAVAQAIASVPTTSYTAGDGIDIDANDEISAKLGNGLSIGTSSESFSEQTVANTDSHYAYYLCKLDNKLISAIESSAGLTYTNAIAVSIGTSKYYPVIAQFQTGDHPNKPDMNYYIKLEWSTQSCTSNNVPANTSHTVTTSKMNGGTITFDTVKQNPSNYCIAYFSSTISRMGVFNSYVESESLTTGSVSGVGLVSGYITVDKPVPATQSSDNGKVLGVTDTSGTLGWVAQPTIPTVDQSYSASSTHAQSGTAVAGALATINQVPASTSADENKVLTVNSSGVAEWATAQGGGSTYTAGAGIDITSDVVSAKIDNSTLTTASTATDAVPFTTQNTSGYDANLMNSQIGASLHYQDTKVYTFRIPSGGIALGQGLENDIIYPVLTNGNSHSGEFRLNKKLNATLDNNTGRYTITGGQTFKVCFNSSSPYYPVALRPEYSMSSYYYLTFGSFTDSQLEDNYPTNYLAGAYSNAYIEYDFKTSGTTLSVDTDVVQAKLTAGNGIVITDSNVISVDEGVEIPITSSTSYNYTLGSKLNYNHLRICFHKYNGSRSDGHLVKDVYSDSVFSNAGFELCDWYYGSLGTTTFTVSSGSTFDTINVGSSYFNTVNNGLITADNNSSWVIDRIFGFNDSPFASQS